MIPLEVRFAHDPKKNFGYVGVALSTTLVYYAPKEDKTWGADVVTEIKP